MKMMLSRHILRFSPKLNLASCSQFRFKSVKSMNQVDVDDPELQAHLGKLRMGFIRKAEKETLVKANKHKKFRKKDWTVGGICVGLILGIYSYTIFAMQQETFLDDFEVPNPLPEEDDEEN